MKVLIACEYSGTVRDAFLEAGHDAISCDLLESDSPGPHIVGNVLDIIYSQQYDLMIAHPPCTYLCSSGLHWNTRKLECTPECPPGHICFTPAAILRQEQTEIALKFISDLWNCGIERICIENPVGILNSRLPFLPRPQYVQPYEYGHDASKKTGFWLKNLPMLGSWAEDYIPPRLVTINGRTYNRWANQTDSGQNALPQSATRGHDRAKTYSGIAWAMVEAWT